MANGTTNEASPPLKGSWEDLLSQARTLEQNQNDACIPIYEKLVTRLRRMPEEQRNGANRRLHQILLVAAARLQSCYNRRDRYADAIPIVELLRDLDDDASNAMWERHLAMVMITAGREDEGFERACEVVESADDRFEALTWLVGVYMRAGQVEKARESLDRMGELAEDESSSDDATVNADDRIGLVELMKANLAFDLHRWDEGRAHYGEALDVSEDFREASSIVYEPLIRNGLHQDAIPYLQRDQQHPARVHLWRGISLRTTGDEIAAEREFLAATRTVNAAKGDDENANEEMYEVILAHFYLGDKEGVGLGSVLETLRRDEQPGWAIYMLAGLGWAVRGELGTATADLRLALSNRKSQATAKTLPFDSWFFFRDLLDDEATESLAEFFEQESVALAAQPEAPNVP